VPQIVAAKKRGSGFFQLDLCRSVADPGSVESSSETDLGELGACVDSLVAPVSQAGDRGENH
jgi:hypothetical protein